ncbi:MAG: T9SS type A sorting domain-containing protein [Saprospiraceae bacterium]
MIIDPKRIFLSALCNLLLVMAWSQTNSCLTFESLETGTTFGRDHGHEPGSIAFEESGLAVRLKPFQYFDGSTDFLWAQVSEAVFTDFELAQGKSLFISNINLFFDFSSLPRPIHKVCIDFFDGGGEENIAVNGRDIKVLRHLGEAPTEIAPGVTLTITPPIEEGQFISTGTLCLEGNIESLLLGGQEFAIDNICFDDCPIYDLKAWITDCQQHPNLYNQYDIQLDFNHETSEQTGFDLYQGDEFIGFYQYNQLPITLPALSNTQNLDAFTFTVCENDSPDCCKVITVPLAPCEELCLLDVRLDGVHCNNSGTEYTAAIGFNGQNTGQKFRATNLAGETRFFEYPQNGTLREVVFATNESGYDKIEICDVDSPDCCFLVEVEYPCQPTPNCLFSDLSANILSCQSTPTGHLYDIKINFNYSGTTNARFDLFSREGLIGSYRFEELPITLTNYNVPGNPDNLYFKVAENDNLECHAVIEIIPEACQEDCSISNVTLWEVNCNAAGTEYIALISIDGQGLGEKFSATNAQGQTYYYPYPAQGNEVQIAFPANESGVDRIEICDYNAPDCCKVLELEYPCRPNTECRLSELSADIINCQSNANRYLYDIKINFDHRGTTNAFFDLFSGERFIGFYRFDDLPITLTNFEVPINATNIHFKVAENDNLACHAVIEIPVTTCETGGTCSISNLFAEAHPCEDGMFMLDLEFDKEGPGPLGYYVFGDGAIFGPFSYELPFVTIGPFVGDGAAIVDLLVLDIADPSCFGYYEFGPLDCSTQCRITNVLAEAHPCENGQFYVDIKFDSENTSEEGFIVRGNGHNYGSFAYGNNIVTIGPIEGDPARVLEFIVIDKADPSCRSFTTLAPIDCPSCQISDLHYTLDCHETGTSFTLNLNFNVSEPSSSRFFLKFDGETFERFAYADLPLSLNLPLTVAEATSLTICDTEAPDCCQTIAFNVPCCSLRDLVVEPYPCEEDGSFLVDLNFFHTNTNEHFTLVYGPENGALQSQTFNYDDLYLTLGPLAGATQRNWLFQVTDEHLFCSTSTQVSFEACEQEACLGFEESSLGSFGPATGYPFGAVIAAEGGMSFSMASDCNCFVHLVTYPSAFPQFSLASGHMMVLDGSGVKIDLSELPAPTASVSLDYFMDGNRILLAVNGNEYISVERPNGFPTIVAPGVSLAVFPSDSQPNMGTLVFTGNISSIAFKVEGKLVLDNICQVPGTEEVWPGDVNTDNIANHFDLLPIGLAFAAEGPIRENESTAWEGLPASSWEQSFANEVNYKHADTDGNGVINAADRVAILNNFNLTHGEVIPYEPIPATPNNPSLFVAVPSDGWPVGQAFNLPIKLGTPALPVDGIYGLAFTLRFDPQVIRPQSIAINFEESWLGSDGQELVTLDKSFAEEGIIYLAISRTNQENIFGDGTVASLIGIIDDIAGRQATDLIIEAPLAITAAMDTIPIFADASRLNIQRFREVPRLDLLKSIVLSPNPTPDEVNISNKYGIPVDKIDVMDSAGNLIEANIKGTNTVSLKAHPAGMYMLRIQIGDLVVHRRVLRL